MKLRTRLTIALIGVIALFMLTTANATGGDKGCTPGHEQRDSCSGGEDGKDGKDGKDGIDGRDGKDGVDGRDGIDGKDGNDGIDGRDGIDGKDGVVDYRIIREWRNYSAAMQAIQIHLPQGSSQRLTLSGSRVNGATGMGLGYAYKTERDDNLAFTVGVGSAGGEQVGVISAGFEFGGERNRYNSRYNASERRIEELERQLRTHEEEVLERCRESTQRSYEKCLRK